MFRSSASADIHIVCNLSSILHSWLLARQYMYVLRAGEQDLRAQRLQWIKCGGEQKTFANFVLFGSLSSACALIRRSIEFSSKFVLIILFDKTMYICIESWRAAPSRTVKVQQMQWPPTSIRESKRAELLQILCCSGAPCVHTFDLTVVLQD